MEKPNLVPHGSVPEKVHVSARFPILPSLNAVSAGHVGTAGELDVQFGPFPRHFLHFVPRSIRSDTKQGLVWASALALVLRFLFQDFGA